MRFGVIQEIAFDWAMRCFGKAHVYDDKVRSLRVVEEAIELCQSVGVVQEDILLVSDLVYQRKPGKPSQEIGGLMMTIMVFCERNGIDAEEAGVTELRRVLSISPEHFAQRNAEKVKPRGS